MMLCPYCGGGELLKIDTQIGTQYGLMEVNAQTKSIHMDSVLPVDLYGCLVCKNVVIKCPSLKAN